MSLRKPSSRDKLEAEYLALAKERMIAVDDFDRRLLAMQAQLDRVEMPRHGGHNSDNEQHASAVDLAAFVAPDRQDEQDCSEMAANEAESATDHGARASRMAAIALGMVRRIAYTKRSARLEAFACIYALGADCESMRTVAKANGVSREWISQLSEAVRIQYNLPKNQHNKPEEAVENFRDVSNMRARKI